jgi:hypothetical protein
MSLPKTQPQPSICDACLGDLYDQLLAGQKPGAVYCSHNSTLAFIRCESDTVQHWRLIGPLTPEEAQIQFGMVDASRQIVLAATIENIDHHETHH